jgi:hypothetical protein
VLSRDQARFVAENICCSDHDYFVWSPLLGEPVLCDGLLCYRDHASVQIVGVPFDPPFEDDRQRASALITWWMRNPGVAFVNYIGAAPGARPPNREWDLVHSGRPRRWNRDIFIDLTARLMDRPATQRAVRRASRDGVRVRVRRRSCLSSAHLDLLATIAERPAMAVSDVSYVTNVTAILRCGATRVFEAYVGDRLVGYTVAHHHFPRTAFMIVAAFDHEHRASDATYGAMIRYYRDRGAKELGLGYATDAGLYRYKTKWGSARVGPPFSQRIWRRRGCDEPFRDCLHWPWRMLIRNWELY